MVLRPVRLLTLLLACIALATPARGWSGRTHIFIAAEAGISCPEAACFPDLTKEESHDLLGPVHYHNAPPGVVITPEYIDRFRITSALYLPRNDPDGRAVRLRVPDPAGVLYFKIVELYRKLPKARSWQTPYYLTTLAHYVGDLSQPLHNYPHGHTPASDGQTYPEQGNWNKKNHGRFDSVLNYSLPLSPRDRELLAGLINVPTITSEADLKQEIARIANRSLQLANLCFAEKRGLTKEEALRQVALSISLLKALREGAGR